MSSEDEFVKHAVQFLDDIGTDASVVEVETDLFDSGVLDSLGTLAFLEFLEQQIGREIDIEQLDIKDIATLRSAYRFVHSHQG